MAAVRAALIAREAEQIADRIGESGTRRGGARLVPELKSAAEPLCPAERGAASERRISGGVRIWTMSMAISRDHKKGPRRYDR
jgi:hypothetical protein